MNKILSSYKRPRVRASKKKTETLSPVDPIAVAKIISRFKTKVVICEESTRIVEEVKDPEVVENHQQYLREANRLRRLEHYNKLESYRPIANFDFYASAYLVTAQKVYKEAKEDYKIAVDCLLKCRHNSDIRFRVNELHKTMTNMKNLDVKKTEERIEKMRELEKIHKIVEPINVPSRISLLPTVDVTHVYVDLKVQKKSKNVKVKLTTPLLDLYDKYYKNLKRPPIGEKIRAYSKIGYPDWYLEKIIESYKKQLQQKTEMEKLIKTVFDKYDAKKPSKAKPKTALQKLNRPIIAAAAAASSSNGKKESVPPPARALPR